MANPHLLQDLTDRGLWNASVRNQLMRDSGSVANIDSIPDRFKELYKTVWEMKMKDIIDMAAERGRFIDQSQSLNLFVADPTTDKLTAMHFYAWEKGLKVNTLNFKCLITNRTIPPNHYCHGVLHSFLTDGYVLSSH
jgi:ribonucleotide reductase alpha subunit